MHRTQKACIIRFVPRANQAVFVGCATPLLGGSTRPDCLVLNYLPFAGWYRLPTVDRAVCLVLIICPLQALITMLSKMHVVLQLLHVR